MRFGLLGPVQLVGTDGVAIPLPGQHERDLLATLLLEHGHAVPRDRLIDILWDDEPPPSAVNALQVQVSKLRSKLRRACGDSDQISTSAAGYALHVAHGELDVDRFVSLTDRRHDDAGVAAETLREALALWRGSALADVRGSAPRARARVLDDMRLATQQRLIDAELDLGRHREVLPEIQALVDQHPFVENLYRQLMLALYRSGRQDAALGVYADARGVLADELGVEPTASLRELQLMILRQDPALEAPSQTVVRPVPARSTMRTRLPRPVTSFVGREAETELLCDLLASRQLVTIVGMGGVGKTRLALEVAARTQAPECIVCLVELAPVQDKALVPGALAHALGVVESPSRTVEQGIVEALATRPAVVVLDNCEHVVDACSELAATLVERCDALRILATSREPLRVSGEHVIRLVPLSTESTAGTLDGPSDAVRLFLERANAQSMLGVLAAPELATIESICRRVDGVPLALELAAAQLRVMALADIDAALAQRIDFLSRGARGEARQRSLESLIDWSYQLLDPDEQRALERMSVFVGGARLDEIVSVCGEDSPPYVFALADKSLLEVDRGGPATRYRMLETVRSFAARRLVERGELEVAQRSHAAVYLELAVSEGGRTLHPEQLTALARLEEELGNLRATARWFLDRSAVDELHRFVEATRWFWVIRGRYEEGTSLVESVLALPGARAADVNYSRTMAALLYLRTWTGGIAQMADLASEGLASARHHGDRVAAADLMHGLVFIAYCNGRVTPDVLTMANEMVELASPLGDAHCLARQLTIRMCVRTEVSKAVDDARAAAAIFRDVGDRHWLAIALNNLADAFISLGDYAEAGAAVDEAIAVCRELDDTTVLASLHSIAGIAAICAKDTNGAHRCFQDAFTIATQAGTGSQQATAVLGLALAATLNGETRRAARLHALAGGVLRQMGQEVSGVEATLTERDRARLLAALGTDGYRRASEEGLAQAQQWARLPPTRRANLVLATGVIETGPASERGLDARQGQISIA